MIIGYGRQTPESLEVRIAGYESQACSMANQTRFTIYDLTADGEPRPVGTTALRIDHYVRTAEYVILLSAEGRGRGLARETTLLTLDYGFHITNLRAVWLKVLERNTAGIRAYEAPASSRSADCASRSPTVFERDQPVARKPHSATL